MMLISTDDNQLKKDEEKLFLAVFDYIKKYLFNSCDEFGRVTFLEDESIELELSFTIDGLIRKYSVILPLQRNRTGLLN